MSPGLFSQKVSVKTTTVSDIFLADSGILPLPKNAVELETALTIRSEHFKSPVKLVLGPNGNIFASSAVGGTIVEFSLAGEIVTSPGRGPAGKSAWRSPFFILAAGNPLVIHETDFRQALSKRNTVLVFDDRGKLLRSLKIPPSTDVEYGADGRVYAAARIEDAGSRLVTVWRPDGSIRAFGEPLATERGSTTLNSRSLAVNKQGDVFVAFSYFPIVRRYSKDGTLLKEIRIETPVYAAKDKHNTKILAEAKDAPEAAPGTLLEIIREISCYDDKVYLLSSNPRLEIAELDENGSLLTTYWHDAQDVYTAFDFVVASGGEGIGFFVSHSFAPKFEIDGFRKSRIKYSEGVLGEIERQTAEIAANPDHYLAWHNRGVAKHQAGDYNGAVYDLRIAVELAPDSALVHHNLGLALVKAKEFQDAILHFTRAVELKPSAAAYFDRGIARVHLKQYKEAIGDFEKSAEMDASFRAKAFDQIAYCRVRLKAGKGAAPDN